MRIIKERMDKKYPLPGSHMHLNVSSDEPGREMEIYPSPKKLPVVTLEKAFMP